MDLSIGEQWDLINSNGSVSLSNVRIPGNVYTELERRKIIDNPYYRYNDVYTRWIAYDEWTYSTFFILPAKLQKVLLIAEGLDTVARVHVNGMLVGESDNMFREYVFDVSDVVEKEQNDLCIEFKSGVKEAKRRREEYPYEVPTSDDPIVHIYSGEKNRNFLRKEQCSFGWDWGPATVGCGIWRGMYLIGFDAYFLRDISIAVDPTPTDSDSDSEEENAFDVTIDLIIDSVVTEDVEVVVGIAELEIEYKETITVDASAQRGEVYQVVLKGIGKNAELWYPRGLGEARLYEVVVSIDKFEKRKKIGFRKIQVVQKRVNNMGRKRSSSTYLEDESMFYFEVNGIEIFAKGANLIPLDSFEDKVTQSVMKSTVQAAIDANMNMLRVWGGGIYQQDLFYDLCDENGILVWQEFMFACALYPVNTDFLQNVELEVAYQIQRLKHHPSVALWSGNNENEASLWEATWYPYVHINPYAKSRLVVDYAKLYLDRIMRVVESGDPGRFFWPSSPSNGILTSTPYTGFWSNPQSENRGDVHYYNYVERCDDVSLYPKGKFVSEYGWQSFPSFSTLEKISIEKDWDLFSDLMMHRQHHPFGNEEILAQLNFFFRPVDLSEDPVEKFKSVVYLSQVLQVICIKTQTEYYRTLPHTRGALYWQLNSIWQAPTWSSLEYGNKWKLLHYAIQNVFSPILITSYINENEGKVRVFVVSDASQKTERKNVEVDFKMYQLSSGRFVSEKSASYTLKSLEIRQIYDTETAQFLNEFNCSTPTAESDCVLFMQTRIGNETVSSNVQLFAPLKEMKLAVPTWEIDFNLLDERTVEITIVSDVFAPYVYVDDGEHGRFSENGFFLTKGQTKVFEFNGTRDVDLDSFKQSFYITTVRDTYR